MCKAAKLRSLKERPPYSGLRRTVRWIGGILLFLLIAIIGIALLLLLPAVQTWTAQKLAERVSSEFGVEVRIDRVALDPFGPLVLKGVFISDLQGDTLIYTELLAVNGLRIHPRSNSIKAGSLELRDTRFALEKARGDTYSNLTQILRKLRSDDPSAAGEAWSFSVGEVKVDRIHFTFTDHTKEHAPFGVDFDHLDVHSSIHGRRFFMYKDSIAVKFEKLALADHSGFQLDRLSGAATVSPRGIGIGGMVLRTPESHIRGELKFTNESWTDYEEFTDRVDMRLQLDRSELDFGDISYFATELEGIRLPIKLKGLIRGTISDLRGRNLEMELGDRTRFSGSADLTGLPDMANTFMLIDVDELRTVPADLATLPVPPFTAGGSLQLPPEIWQLGEISFAGNFTGFTSSFTAYGTSNTALGELRTDLSYERNKETDIFTLSGRAATNAFRIGPLLKTDAIGPLAANIRIKGSGRSLAGMHVDLQGSFPFFTFQGRRIAGIEANGRLERNLFNGELKVADEHLVMDFKGLADMRGRWPEVDFSAEVGHIDLKALGFLPDQEYSALSVSIDAKGRVSPDSLLGRLEAQDVSYCDANGDHELGDIVLRSGRTMGRNVLELESEFADATITGTFLPTKLGRDVTDVIYSVFPVLREEMSAFGEDQRFDFTVYAKHTEAVLGLFVPGLVIDSGAVLEGSLDSREYDVDLSAQLPGVQYKDFHALDLELFAAKALDVLAFRLDSERQTWQDSIWFEGTSMTGKAYQDEIELAFGWKSSSSGTNGEVDLIGEVRGSRSIALDLLPSRLDLGRGNWQNDRTVHLEIDSSMVRIDSLVVQNSDQRLAVDGTISPDPGDPLAFILDQVELENFAPFLGGPKFEGVLNGSGQFFDLYKAPIVRSELRVDSVVIDGHEIGNVHLSAGWTQGQRAVELQGHIDRGAVKALDFNGQMILDEERSLELDLVMDRFDLKFIEPYLPSGLSDIQGIVTGTIDVTGNLGDPQLNGEVELFNAGLRIDYLNTLYTFDHRMKVAPDMFALDNVVIRDDEGNTATLVGTIIHDGLKDINYDISGSLDRLKVLETTIEQNDIFYGKAYGHGDVSVSGHAGFMEIDVDARTAAGTDIHFPIGGSTEVSAIGFINFISTDTGTVEEPPIDLAGVTLDMQVEVTPDAHFELIFDPTVGDIISGRGRGNIEMSVGQTGRFDMRGQVEISDGDYLFTLQNVVNKRFQLQPGGTIMWFGDPLDAHLDLQATYRVRAPLYDIMYEKNDAYRRRVPIDVVMQLRDRLLNPEINFEIRLPSVDEAVRTQVNSAMSTEDELNRQVFALIVLNRFVPPPSYAQSQEGRGGNVAGTTGFELMSNQVSNWLSRLSSDFDLGVNYRLGDNISQDEFEVAVSTQLFEERLLLSTNLGVAYGQQTTQNTNTLIGDFLVEYLLTQDGRLRLKAFSQSNDRNLNRTDQALTTQGAGLAYRVEFDNIWDRFFGWLGPKRKEEIER